MGLPGNQRRIAGQRHRLAPGRTWLGITMQAIQFAGVCCRSNCFVRVQGKLVGRLNDMCVPQPVDDCLRVLGDALCHHADIPPVISIHAAPNAEHAVRAHPEPWRGALLVGMCVLAVKESFLLNDL